jgi:hypothetical protein
MSTDPGDAELVDVRLPERIDLAPLESLERLEFLDGTVHEPVTFQHTVHRDPGHLDPAATKDGMDP